jgi:lipopolysaccharide transport system ATP-binding protein
MDALTVHSAFAIEVDYWNLRCDAGLDLSLRLYNEEGVLVFSSGRTQEQASGAGPGPDGLLRDSCHVPGDLLNDGVHRVELFIVRRGEVLHHDPDFLTFSVSDSPNLRGQWFGKWAGAVRPNLRWQTERLDSLPST